MLFALEDTSDLTVPKESESQETGRRGLVFTQNDVVNNLNWGFYKTDGDDDHGIDATLEPKKENKWSGQLIGVQVKTTNKPMIEGNCYKYYIKREHFEYWTNYSIPVVVILCHLDAKRCFWAQVSPKTVIKTPEGYKIYIPTTHLLSNSLSKILLTEIAENGNLLQTKISIFFRTQKLIEILDNGGRVTAEHSYNASSDFLGGYKYIDFSLFDVHGNIIDHEAFFIPFFKDGKPDESIPLAIAIKEFLPWANTRDENSDIHITLNQYGRDFWKIKNQLEVK